MSIKTALTSLLTLGASLTLCANSFASTPISPNAKAYIVSPTHGQVVTSPVTVVFGLTGAGVAPAGVNKENTGHHHLIINAATPDMSKSIGKDDKHKHFGGGQTQTSIDLPPGKHTLQLVLGDAAHVPHNPPVVSKTIEIIVQ